MRRIPVIPALICALALLAVACGGSKDTGFSPTPTPTETGHGEDTSTREDPAPLDGPILVEDNKYTPRYVAAEAGAAVTWEEAGAAPHNVVSVDDLFDSNPDCLQDTSTCMADGEEFTFTFDEPGEYGYYCVIHGRPNGLDDPGNMAGIIIVS